MHDPRPAGALAVLSLAALIGCSSGRSGSAATTTPSASATAVEASAASSSAAAPTLLTGTYIDGASGTPHYFVTLRVAGDAVAGTLAFVYQDGQTGDAQPFTGAMQGGIVTLNFKDGSTGTAALGPSSTFELGECQQWMRFTRTRADCDFRPASSVNP